MGAELADNNLDNKLANLREVGAKSRARAKFEAARQARLAKESGQATPAKLRRKLVHPMIHPLRQVEAPAENNLAKNLTVLLETQ